MPDAFDPPFPPVWPWSVFSSDGFGANMVMFRGDSFTFTRSMYEANGSTHNYSGATLQFRAKYEAAAGDASAVIYKTIGSGISASNVSAGEYKVTIAPSDTSGFPPYPVDLEYDVQENVSGSGVILRTVLRGTITVRPDISISSS